MVGDIDDSYEFAYYLDGECVRRRSMADRLISTPGIEVDTGLPLRGEDVALGYEGPEGVVEAVARAIGIDTTREGRQFRRYESS